MHKAWGAGADTSSAVNVVAHGGCGRRRHVRALGVAVVLAALALALPWHAVAQVPTPPGDLPVPTTLPGLLDGDGGVPVTTTTTVPPPPTTTTTTAPAEQPRADPGTATQAPLASSRRSSANRTAATGVPAPSAGATLVERVAAETPDSPAIARLRRVTVPAARQFGFPLALGVMVLAFLAVQARLDARDPKLAAAPVTVDDDLLPFA